LDASIIELVEVKLSYRFLFFQVHLRSNLLPATIFSELCDASLSRLGSASEREMILIVMRDERGILLLVPQGVILVISDGHCA
jgi:hypothetical protein